MKTLNQILWFVFLAAVIVPAARAEEKYELVFIVNASNPIRELSADDIADFFFKRKKIWDSGNKVQFIDQKDGTARKEYFLEKILKKSLRDIDLFWIGEKNFTGHSAPIQAPSDSMVIATVASLPGAIGYVSASEINLNRVKRISVKRSN